ncbi:hypothetical protein M0P65_07465 [Candidatus Gracilibacteria bacterium]|jgi:hypothetical protein|nr:hypothetical protein [Candidatus Gracilibacteria bacterium]
MATQLDLADAQLLGFSYAKDGYSITMLVEDMGLTKSEWLTLKKKYPIVIYLSESDIDEIDKNFE